MENRKNFSLCKRLNWLFNKKHRKVKALEDIPQTMEKDVNSPSLPTINFESPMALQQQQITTAIVQEVTATSEAQPHEERPKTMDDALRLARSALWHCEWYWGKLDRTGAQKKLAAKPNGSFLVRDSQTEHTFTLSFR